MTDLPQAAIDAALEVIKSKHLLIGHGRGSDEMFVQAVLAAAAPHLAAAERERIAQLAEKHHATFTKFHAADCPGHGRWPFAALIRQETHDDQ